MAKDKKKSLPQHLQVQHDNVIVGPEQNAHVSIVRPCRVFTSRKLGLLTVSLHCIVTPLLALRQTGTKVSSGTVGTP